jgi:hypothetical protein
MAAHRVPVSDSAIRDALKKAGSQRGAERLLRGEGKVVSARTIKRVIERDAAGESDFVIDSLPSDLPSFDELLAERVKKYDAKAAHYEATRTFNVYCKIKGPIGIGFFGDWHVDDDGTDLDLLVKHAELFDGRNKGLYGAFIGDARNNWQGRLARLWADQSTSAAESRVLLTGIVKMVNWLLFLKGNHDVWSGHDDLLDWLLQGHAVVTRPWRAIFHLKFPNGRVVRIYASHDFKGRSMWNNAYGPARKAQLHGDADIYICGHLHTSGYQHGYRPNGDMWHAVRIDSYKRIDDYVEELDIEPTNGYACPVALVDPDADKSENFIRWEWDPFEAAARLAWMRTR